MNTKDVVFITGGLTGVGFELTKIYAKNGYKVYASKREQENPEVPQFEGKENVTIVVMDLLDPGSAKNAVETALKESGHIDILINNAASGYYSSVEDIDTELLVNQYKVNVVGTVLMSKLVLPSMRENKKGKIINVSSILGFSTAALNAPYSSGKYAIESISETLALEVKPFGIDVIIMEPGDFHTSFIKNAVLAKYSDNSPYLKLYKRMEGNSKSGQRGKDPKVLAEVIFKVSQYKNPKLRYMVGKEVLVKKLLHTLLHDNLWIAFMRKYYHW